MIISEVHNEVRTVPCHLLVPVGADSVACSCRSKIFCSFLTSAKRNALQSPSHTGLSCNHFKILGLFQFDGQGLGTISYSAAQQLISQIYSRFCGCMDAFGSFDHGLMSKEKRWVPSSSTRPMDSTCRVFFELWASKYTRWHSQDCCTPVLCDKCSACPCSCSWPPPVVGIMTSSLPPPCRLLLCRTALYFQCYTNLPTRRQSLLSLLQLNSNLPFLLTKSRSKHPLAKSERTPQIGARTRRSWEGSWKVVDEIKQVMKLLSKLRFLIFGTLRFLGTKDPQNKVLENSEIEVKSQIISRWALRNFDSLISQTYKTFHRSVRP